jgi:thiosulfate/3-mercaptopyruvate sulfurtransferase
MTQRIFRTLIDVDSLHEFITRHPADVVVFDARFDLAAPDAGRREYEAGHLPGARYLHLDHDLSGEKTGSNGRHPLPPRERLAKTFGAYGVSTSRRPQVVAYDAQGGAIASRVWWLLRWLGYERIAVLDGGIQAWTGAGLPLESTLPDVREEEFIAGDSLVRTVDTAAVLASLASRSHVLIDARGPDRFRGENETLDPVGGHIPGARNRFFKDNLTADGRFKPVEQLRFELEQVLRGAAPERVVLQCGSGVTACHNALALEHVGIRGAALYPGSWSEWVADRSRPIAVGPEDPDT